MRNHVEDTMNDTVTVHWRDSRFWVTFARLPGKEWGPWGLAETVRDLTVSALLAPMDARNLALDAVERGSATTITNA